MQKAIFIYNPVSGGQNITNSLDYIISRFQEKDILIQPYRICGVSNEKLIEALKYGCFDFAVISGGDGTLNSMVNLLINNNINIPIGILPAGTCNDYARSLVLPSTIEGCLDVVLKGKLQDVDVGMINNETYFLSTCAGGFFVNVSFNTDSELKKNFGPFAYYLKAITEVANLKTFEITIETDNEVIKEEIILFLVLNGSNAGGFRNLVKEADVSDGFMEIVLIKKCNGIDMASIFFNVLSNDYLNNKNVAVLKTRSCKLFAEGNVPISIDGEKGKGLPIEISFKQRCLKVFVK